MLGWRESITTLSAIWLVQLKRSNERLKWANVAASTSTNGTADGNNAAKKSYRCHVFGYVSNEWLHSDYKYMTLSQVYVAIQNLSHLKNVICISLSLSL